MDGLFPYIVDDLEKLFAHIMEDLFHSCWGDIFPYTVEDLLHSWWRPYSIPIGKHISLHNGGPIPYWVEDLVYSW